MSSEIQKDDVILPGNLGTINVGGVERRITAAKSDYTKGSLTITIGEVVQKYLDKKNNIEDVEFEIIEPKQLPNATTR